MFYATVVLPASLEARHAAKRLAGDLIPMLPTDIVMRMHHIVEADDLGLDVDNLARWMDERQLGAGSIRDVRRIGGGTQNIVVSLHRGDVQYILRRPPLSGRPDGSKTILREAAILRGLDETAAVPHPPLLATCEDTSVIGAAFYLMAPVRGFNPASDMPQAIRSDAAFQRALGFSMVDAVVELGKVDVTRAPLAELGTADGWLRRQLPRWIRRLSALDAIDGYVALPSDRVRPVVEWLEDQHPTDEIVGLVHGDYHFANVIADEQRPVINAIVDWELAGPGDPRIDIAHLVTTMCIETMPGLNDLRHATGLPSVEELLCHYTDRTGTDPAAMRWFRAFACLRLATLLEETMGRSAAGHANAALAQRFRRVTLGLLDQAEHVIDGRPYYRKDSQGEPAT